MSDVRHARVLGAAAMLVAALSTFVVVPLLANQVRYRRR